MPHVQWDTNFSTVSVDQSFLDTFSNLGFEQVIQHPTHIKGNILDLLLTDNPSFLGNVKVNNGWHLSKSDHFPITFNVKFRVARNKTVRREIYNFKRADWNAINNELRHLNWNRLLLFNDDIEFSWSRFKAGLFSVTDKHIPKIKIGNSDQPPWFDSETYAACREKEWFRERYNSTNSAEHYAKF